MASWSTRRKYGFFFGFIVALAILGGIPAFLVFYKAPTCFDGKKNGTERGVDCGGTCARLCPADFSMPRVLWSYSVRVVPGVYNALAYVQNPNQIAEAVAMPYVFRLYDDKGILIVERTGKAFVPAGQKFSVFEGALETGERIPAKTIFEFTDEPSWRTGSIFSELRVESVDLSQDAPPRAEVRVQNETANISYQNVDAFIVLYDASDNRVSFSKTTIEKIGPGEEQTLYFTWPEAFQKPIVRSEVLFVSKPKN